MRTKSSAVLNQHRSPDRHDDRALPSTASPPAAVGSALTVSGLRAERAANPIGLDVEQPRLSWVLESDERGQRQSAYTIQVASDEEQLLDGTPDVWDSGKVWSDDSVAAAYQGPPLASGGEWQSPETETRLPQMMSTRVS